MTKVRLSAISGAVTGLILIGVVIGLNLQSPVLILSLWPTSIVGFGYQGESPWTTGLIIGALEILGQVAIFGAFGAMVGRLMEKFSARGVNA